MRAKDRVRKKMATGKTARFPYILLSQSPKEVDPGSRFPKRMIGAKIKLIMIPKKAWKSFRISLK